MEMKTKTKWLASLVLASSLSGCSSIGHTPPSSFQIPPSLSIELGSDGCPIEEPCYGYEAERDAEEARAWAAFDSYAFEPVDLPMPIQQTYVGMYVEGVTELTQAQWTLTDPEFHEVVYVFQSEALTTI